MNTLIAICLAAIYGLIMRLLFGFIDGSTQIMSITFLIVIPILIGFLTVMADKTSSETAAFFKPWLTSLVILGITLMIKVEGIICWVLLFPLFATLAGIGGLIAYHYKKNLMDPAKHLNRPQGPRPNTLNVSLMFMVPVALGYLEGERAWTPQEITISEQLTIDAPVAKVWQALAQQHVLSRQQRVPLSSALLGFPRHIATTLDTLAVGGTRVSSFEKGLRFQENVVRLEKERFLTFSVNTEPGQFPPTVMDEHVMIGGKHLDILDDTYQLQALPGGRTRVVLAGRFYINTPFNWYARLWANYLVADMLQGELQSVQARALAVRRTGAASGLRATGQPPLAAAAAPRRHRRVRHARSGGPESAGLWPACQPAEPPQRKRLSRSRALWERRLR